MGLLDNRTAVVTGAAQGLGMAMARDFIAQGANVVLGDVDLDRVTAAARELHPERARGVVCDVTDGDQVERMLQSAVDLYGDLHVAVNNAGFTRDATMRKMPETDFDAVISVHLKGTWLGTRAAAAIMRKMGTSGSIINVSSISGKVGNAGQTNYSAAKAGIVGLTKAAAKELGFAGIRVNAIQPGIISTPMTDAMRPDIKEARLKDVPLGRFGEPEEVASVVTFLASDMSSYMTGTVLEIAGGRNI